MKSWRGGYGQSGCCLKRLNPPFLSWTPTSVTLQLLLLPLLLFDAKISVFSSLCSTCSDCGKADMFSLPPEASEIYINWPLRETCCFSYQFISKLLCGKSGFLQPLQSEERCLLAWFSWMYVKLSHYQPQLELRVMHTGFKWLRGTEKWIGFNLKSGFNGS